MRAPIETMTTDKLPIEKMSMHDLLKEWQAELGLLQSMEQSNPTWDWKPVQLRLERLHALAHELRKRKSEERAKWQP
jgi:hypothetical protein